MILNSERVAYAGLLGVPAMREFGSISVYASLGNPFRVSMEHGIWETADMAVVPPYTRHQVATPDREIGVLKIEPESVDVARLPPFLQRGCAYEGRQVISARIRDTFLGLSRGGSGTDLSSVDIDLLFFGQALPRRQQFDPRIALIVERINQRLCDPFPAEYCAHLTGLSFWRFLHLFKAEMGTTFRRFRAWKRARGFLAYVNRKSNLTDVALEIGYPDSTHFSHSIRHFYGLTPKDIFAGSRRLAVVLQNGSFQSAVRV